MKHTHNYDAQGKQLCCTEEAKINAQADALLKHKPVKDRCCATDEHDQDSDVDAPEHASDSDNNVTLFLPAAVSLIALSIALILDNYVPQTWFTGWLRIGWYVVAYLPVGLPVLREAVGSIIKGDVFSEFLLMSIATLGAFAIGEYPEGVAVMLFYSVGEVFQTLAVKRAKTNIKTRALPLKSAKNQSKAGVLMQLSYH